MEYSNTKHGYLFRQAITFVVALAFLVSGMALLGVLKPGSNLPIEEEASAADPISDTVSDVWEGGINVANTAADLMGYGAVADAIGTAFNVIQNITGHGWISMGVITIDQVAATYCNVGDNAKGARRVTNYTENGSIRGSGGSVSRDCSFHALTLSNPWPHNEHTLKATPAPGYRFVNWIIIKPGFIFLPGNIGNGATTETGTTLTRKIAIVGYPNEVITAVFALQESDNEIKATAGGAVQVTMQNGTTTSISNPYKIYRYSNGCITNTTGTSKLLSSNGSVSFTAVPSTGYKYICWEDSSSPPRSYFANPFVINTQTASGYSITAKFEGIKNNLTVNVVGGVAGVNTVYGRIDTSVTSLDYFTDVWTHLNSNIQYNSTYYNRAIRRDSVNGALISGTGTNMSGARTVYVIFTGKPYTITTNRGVAGTGASTLGGTFTVTHITTASSTPATATNPTSIANVPYASFATFKVTAINTGYTFKGWYSAVNGTGTLHSTAIEYRREITASVSVYAVFEVVTSGTCIIHYLIETAPMQGGERSPMWEFASTTLKGTSAETITLYFEDFIRLNGAAIGMASVVNGTWRFANKIYYTTTDDLNYSLTGDYNNPGSKFTPAETSGRTLNDFAAFTASAGYFTHVYVGYLWYN